MEEIVLRSAHPHSWLRTVTEKYSAKARIMDSKVLSQDVVEHLFEINVKPELASKLLQEIREDEDVLGMETVKSKGGRIYGSVKVGRCTICKEVAKSKCFLASVVIDERAARWTILGNHNSSLELLTDLERSEARFEVIMKRGLEERQLLSARQEEILFMAFERGYFDFPKKLGLKELAKEIGVRPSTLTEILRRGQKKVFGEYFSRREFQESRGSM